MVNHAHHIQADARRAGQLHPAVRQLAVGRRRADHRQSVQRQVEHHQILPLYGLSQDGGDRRSRRLHLLRPVLRRHHAYARVTGIHHQLPVADHEHRIRLYPAEREAEVSARAFAAFIAQPRR